MLPLWIAFETFRGESPLGEGEAVDLRVVADIDREARMEVEEFDPGGVLVGEAEGAQLPGEGAALRGIFQGRFNDEGRALLAAFAEADEGAAGDARVLAKNLFAGLCVLRAKDGDDAFDFAADEPEHALCVEVAAVAHAMPDRAGRRGSSK